MRIIRENSSFRTYWDFSILVLTVLSCAIVPAQISFSHKVIAAGTIVLYFIDVFFVVDIFLNFRTSYRRGGTEVVERGEIRNHYLKTMFAVDVLAAFPFDVLLLGFGGYEIHGVSVVLLLRTTRLLRIVRLFYIFRRWEAKSWTNSAFLRIGKFFSVIIIIIHWIACAWFFVPFIEGFPVNSWVASEGITDADAGTQYLRSFYWAVVTMTTVGYGDITPGRNVEYAFTIVVMLLGASMYAFIIGNLASLFSSVDSAKATFWNRVEATNQYLRSRHVAAELNDQIRDYYDYLWTRYRGMNERDLFSDLPAPVRLEVLLQLTKDLIQNVPLFKYCSPALRNALLLALQPQIFAPGTHVVREGEKGKEIFFISTGEVEILSSGRRLGKLEGGDYFGDLSMLLNENRTASVRAVTFCDIFLLEKRDFNRIREEYAELREVLKKVSSERSEKMSGLILDGVVL
jgi:hypothetical protein